jgi:choline dehydrogenase-like flavoprotein
VSAIKHARVRSYDVIIVGCGMTGSWAARELTAAGLETLIVDAGPFHDPACVNNLRERTPGEPEKFAERQRIQSQHASYLAHDPRLFVDDIDNPYITPDEAPFLWIRGRQVGGRSLTWGGVVLRFSDFEFRAAERDGGGASWPFGYKEISPFYDRVERFLGVEGSYEGLPQLPDGIFARPPPLTETELRFKKIVEARWQERRVVNCRGVSGKPGIGAPGDGRWPRRTSLHAVLPAALATGQATLKCNCVVSHLVLTADGSKVAGVAGIERESNRPFEVHGRIVVLCASTIESVRIMLNSRHRKHRHGVGNSSGLLGHFLLDHAVVSIGGTIANTDQSSALCAMGGSHGIVIPRFLNLGQQHHSLLRGYGMWGGMQRGYRSESGEAPWFLQALIEVLPRHDNRVCIDDSCVDAWSIGATRIEFRYCENDLRLRQHAESCMREMADAAGLSVSQVTTVIPGGYVHELGGARMGTDPSESILNPFNQCWDVNNLFVLDGACFVTSGWQNPTLTMMALAARACQFIVNAVKSGPLGL